MRGTVPRRTKARANASIALASPAKAIFAASCAAPRIAPSSAEAMTMRPGDGRADSISHCR
jgi:hypothetical protein